MAASAKNGRKRDEKEIVNDIDQNHNQPPTKKRKISIHQKDLIAYECVICKELPPSKIYQCVEGHLICEGCYDNPHFQPRTCIRNRTTENTLKFRETVCSNAQFGWQVTLTYHQLDKHLENECEFKLVKCKCKCFGCAWIGPRKYQHQHENECKQRLNIDAILQSYQNKCDELDNTQNVLFNFGLTYRYCFEQSEQKMDWTTNISFESARCLINAKLLIKYENVDNEILIKSKLILDVPFVIFKRGYQGHMIFGHVTDSTYDIFGCADLIVEKIDEVHETGWIILATLRGAHLARHYELCSNGDKYVLSIFLF